MPLTFNNKNGAIINYAFVPATLPVVPAIVGPGTDFPLSHIRPIPGGVNAVLRIRWEATSPILCGNEGGNIVYHYKKTDDKTVSLKDKSSDIRLTSPLKNGENGKFTLSGSALAGMIRNVLKVATGSYYAPINKKYKGNFGRGLERGEYPITSADINKKVDETNEAREKGTEEKKGPPMTRSEERKVALGEMKGDNSDWQTIAKVADRTYCLDQEAVEPALDWTNAMMGFVLGERNNAATAEEQWRPDWPRNVSNQFPQGIESRVAFSFADCLTENPPLWPGDANTALKINGAGPKVSYYPTYLETGRWNTLDAKLAGLKVYPVHDPHLGESNLDSIGLTHDSSCALFTDISTKDRGLNPDVEPVESDTLLQFLDAPLEFEGTICCRNLAPEEFGALIWALFLGAVPEEFGETNDDLRHNLGHLRGFGMGQLKPVLVSAKLSINPTEENARIELAGKRALARMEEAMDAFEDCEAGKKTAPARARLVLFKSRSYGERLKNHYKRLKSYRKPNGKSDSDLLANLKVGVGFRLVGEDDRIAAKEEKND